MSNKVERITISVEAPLLAKFENYISSNGYPTRSEAMKSLMRQALIEEEWGNRVRRSRGRLALFMIITSVARWRSLLMCSMILAT